MDRKPSFLLVVAIAAAGAPLGLRAQAEYGDSLRGAAVLRERGCIDCHAVSGRGGGAASDLGVPGARPFSPAEFTAGLWNHAPAMWDRIAAAGRDLPPLGPQEVRDVFSYLYSMRYFEPAGDAARGRRLFEGLQCHRCHALVRTEAGGIGPAVPDWPSLGDPVLFLERMWNHGAAMQREKRLDGIRHVRLNTGDLADLLAYIYNLPGLPPQPGRIQLGAPQAGMRLFDDLRCAVCHSVGEGAPDQIPLIAGRVGRRTLTDLAVEMWNHRPIMEEWAESTGVEIPTLEPGQMGQLLSYLFDEGFLDEPGNEKRGARVFETRGCALCHTDRQRPIPRRAWRTTDLVAAVWPHGDAMRRAMVEQGVEWPRLSARDMADLTAWLHARQ